MASLKSNIDEWYLDDGSIGGNFDSVIDSDIKTIISASAEVVLKLNLNDMEITELNRVIPGIMVPSPKDFYLLGAPLTLDGVPAAIAQKIESIALLISRLEYLNAHYSF